MGLHESEVILKIDQVMALWYRKFSIPAIATELKMTATDVLDVIESVKQTWREKTVLTYAEKQQEMEEEEVQTINIVMNLAFRGYEQGTNALPKGFVKTTIKRISELGDSLPSMPEEFKKIKALLSKKEPSSMTTVDQTYVHDKAYLDVILKCIELRCKIRGTFAPVISKVDKTSISLKSNLAHLTPEERAEWKKDMIKELIASGEVGMQQFFLPEQPKTIPYKLPSHLAVINEPNQK